jgi:hypothetical protein
MTTLLSLEELETSLPAQALVRRLMEESFPSTISFERRVPNSDSRYQDSKIQQPETRLS